MKLKLTALLSMVLILSACAPASTATPPAATEPGVVNPMPVILPDGSPAAVTEMVVTNLATYNDDAYGFAFDYPAEWMLDVIALGDRAPHSIQLTSWQHEPGMITDVQAGGTVMNVIVQLWDPKGDLLAFVDQRTLGWEVDSILSQEELTLANDRLAYEFVLLTADAESYFLFTLLGDQYLVFSGSGDVEVLRQVARSLR